MISFQSRRFFSQLTQKPVIGFIGLGQMGYLMAGNLSRSPASAGGLVVYDIVHSAVDSFAKEHTSKSCPITVADSINSVVKKSDVIITMLPSPDHIRQIYLDQFLGQVKPNTLLIDSSTIDPATSRLVSKELTTQSKALVIDAPVSGGVVGARDATLTFMVGGDVQAMELAKPILQSMGKSVVHCGQSGSGQVAKICNNMILGSTMVALSEALVLGERLGLDPNILNSIINTSSGRCWSSDCYNPVPGFLQNVPASRNYQGGFSTALMQKDLGLALSAAESVKAPVPMAAAADNVYKAAMNVEAIKKLDMGFVYQWLHGGWKKFVK